MFHATQNQGGISLRLDQRYLAKPRIKEVWDWVQLKVPRTALNQRANSHITQYWKKKKPQKNKLLQLKNALSYAGLTERISSYRALHRIKKKQRLDEDCLGVPGHIEHRIKELSSKDGFNDVKTREAKNQKGCINMSRVATPRITQHRIKEKCSPNESGITTQRIKKLLTIKHQTLFL